MREGGRGGINADNNNSRDYGESRMEGGKFQAELLLRPLLADQRWKTMTRNTNKIGREESEHVSYNKKIKFIIRIKEEKLRAPATIRRRRSSPFSTWACRSFLS